MRRLLVLLLLGLGSGVSCLPLEPICLWNQFDYQGVRVNAIYRTQINVTLEPVSHYAIPLFDDCSNLDWARSVYKADAQKVKDEYNRLVTGIYSERFLNAKHLNPGWVTQYSSKIFRLGKHIKRILTNMQSSSSVSNCLKAKFIAPMKRGEELIDNLAPFYGGQLPKYDEQALKLGKSEMLKMLEREIARMDNNLKNSQTMAFRSELIADWYGEQIAKMGKFVFNGKSKLFLDVSSDGRVNFEIIFPFEDTDLQTGKGCVSSTDLPYFFRKNSPN